MPQRVNPTHLRTLEELIDRHPDGIGMAALAADLGPNLSRRTLHRYLARLVDDGRIQRKGSGRATVYLPRSTERTPQFERSGERAEFETTDGTQIIQLSAVGSDTLDYVTRPLSARRPVGYAREFLDSYEPNRSVYLPDITKAHLHKIGKPIVADRAAGTFARDILSRVLIDLSWSSSRLEGNTYTRIDTQRLIEFGQAAEGKDATETQMILNHKSAIELLVDGGTDVGCNSFTFLNLHSLLSENLMADPEAVGRLRRRPVEVGNSVYTPLAIPQLVEECFELIIEKAEAIADPFEQAFFVMAQLPYLQPFEDVNKRVSRLGANISLIQHNLCPLSFIDVPEHAYITGTLGIYELTKINLLRDIFVWAYERSCQKYVVIRDSLVEPDIFRMKYRNALTEVIGGIIRESINPSDSTIKLKADPLIDKQDLDKFSQLVKLELERLHEGNIARYRIGLTEYRAWRDKPSASTSNA